MSRSVTKGNAFVSDKEVADRPASPQQLDSRPASLHSGELHSDELTDERSDERKSDKKSLRSASEGYRRRDSFGEKSEGFERGYASTPVATTGKQPVTNYTGSYAPNPSFIRLLRFLLYGLSSLASLATAGVGISVIHWYMSRDDSIKPSWGSLIALIIFGIITPGAYFATFLITPRLFRYGTVLGIVNQVRIELLLVFGLAVIWVSGALAMANDLRGYENCIWDGYYHVPEPDNFNQVCDLINATVIMGYITFGLVTLTWFVVTAFAVYILLYLDQEVLSELTNDMGGRAYRARTFARQELPPQASPPPSSYGEGRYAGAAGMHRRTSSQYSRKSPRFNEYEDEYDGRGPMAPASQYGTARDDGGGEIVSSRQIPNPDAAVPMTEKQQLASRYSRHQRGEFSSTSEYSRDDDPERGGHMMR